MKVGAYGTKSVPSRFVNLRACHWLERKVGKMSDWPDLTSFATIRKRVQDALAPLGSTSTAGGQTFRRETAPNLIHGLSLNGRGFLAQSLFLQVTCVPANKLAVDVWGRLERWKLGQRKELSPGVSNRASPFRNAAVCDQETGTRQRWWHFHELPNNPTPAVSLESFCDDVRSIAEGFVGATPDLAACLAYPRLRTATNCELEPTVCAILRDRDGFERRVSEVNEVLEMRRLQAEEARLRAQLDHDRLFVRTAREELNYQTYFDELRRRVFA